MALPDDWPTASVEQTERALLEVQRRLSDDERTAADLAACYDPGSEYAGPVSDVPLWEGTDADLEPRPTSASG